MGIITLVKEQCRMDMRKYSFSQRVINEWNKLPNDCVNASSVNVFKNRIDRYLKKGGLHIDEKIVGLWISQWLPCPLAIWNLLFGMAILLNLVKLPYLVNIFCSNEHCFTLPCRGDNLSIRMAIHFVFNQTSQMFVRLLPPKTVVVS